MIAKKTHLNISSLQNSSLQSSLQKLQLSFFTASTFCLQSSLQMQAALQTVCKENKPGLQHLTKIPFAGSFARNTSLTIV